MQRRVRSGRFKSPNEERRGGCYNRRWLDRIEELECMATKKRERWHERRGENKGFGNEREGGAFRENCKRERQSCWEDKRGGSR